MKQGPHTGRRNGPHPLVLADTEYSFDTGSEIPAFDDEIALGRKRGFEKPGTVRILDVAQDNVRGGQSASHNFLYSRIGKLVEIYRRPCCRLFMTLRKENGHGRSFRRLMCR
jgi:hypothetical protein